MRRLLAVAILGLAVFCSVLLWVTPYRHTSLKGLPVRIHRITGHAEVLYPSHDGTREVFRWVAAEAPTTAPTNTGQRTPMAEIPEGLEPVTDVESVLLEQVRGIRKELDARR